MRKSLQQLNYLERYRNEGTKTYSQHADYTEAQDQFQPGAQVPSFELPCFKIARDRVHIYTANPAPELSAIYIDQEHVLFCVHPQVLAELNTDPYVVEIQRTGHPCAPFKVTPSSSTRTLLVLGMTPEHSLKVHFPFRISRYGRKLRDEVIEQAINVSREMEAGIGVFDRRFAFLREVIGVAHKNLSPESPRGENWGYLVRDMQPFPEVKENRQLVPGFALYGSDLLKREKVPLLFELIDQTDPCGDILENIMLPIIRHWITCFQHFGFLLEPHGQNTLFEIDRNRQIRRIVHRDLSVGIDMRRRRELKRTDDSINGYNRMETGHFHSITYDKFIGSHFFDRLVDLCCTRYPQLHAEDFRRPCRDEFARLFPQSQDYMPGTIQYFKEEYDEFGKPFYEDTGELPVWRPV